jgi:hypothetical protein
MRAVEGQPTLSGDCAGMSTYAPKPTDEPKWPDARAEARRTGLRIKTL